MGAPLPGTWAPILGRTTRDACSLEMDTNGNVKDVRACARGALRVWSSGTGTLLFRGPGKSRKPGAKSQPPERDRATEMTTLQMKWFKVEWRWSCSHVKASERFTWVQVSLVYEQRARTGTDLTWSEPWASGIWRQRVCDVPARIGRCSAGRSDAPTFFAVLFFPVLASANVGLVRVQEKVFGSVR
jgi:hypothetical protein